jgi:hypothetical protein
VTTETSAWWLWPDLRSCGQNQGNQRNRAGQCLFHVVLHLKSFSWFAILIDSTTMDLDGAAGKQL